MSISSDVLSHILGYATKYPQKYSISKEQYSLSKKTTKEEFNKKYPNFMRDIETFKYHVNRAALLKQWEDINIMVSLTSNIDDIFHDKYVKYAITVFHRFNKDDMADELIKKYKPEFVLSLLAHDYTGIDIPNELVLMTRSLYLGGEYEDNIREEFKDLKKSKKKTIISKIIQSEYQIGNVDQNSWKFLTGKTVNSFNVIVYLMVGDPIKLEIPINNRLDIYSYTMKSIKDNKILDVYWVSNRSTIAEISIVTPTIINNIYTMVKRIGNIFPTVYSVSFNPVLVNLFYNNMTINPNTGSNVIKDIIESKK